MSQQKIGCGAIWGGVHGADLEAETGGLVASLFSSSADGQKGGDIYFLSCCQGDVLTKIAIADVTGHGEVVADISQKLYGQLLERINSASGDSILRELNQYAVNTGFRAITTATIASFQRLSEDLYYASAGHHPILVRREDESDWIKIELPRVPAGGNAPLGVGQDQRFDQCDVKLRPGDQIFLHTDGLIDVPDGHGERFGETRLMDVLTEGDRDARQLKRQVLDAMGDFSRQPFDHDDTTFIAATIR